MRFSLGPLETFLHTPALDPVEDVVCNQSDPHRSSKGSRRLEAARAQVYVRQTVSTSVKVATVGRCPRFE
jgi:hypothetical protein